MGLVLGLREGQKVQVGTYKITVTDIMGRTKFRILAEGEDMNYDLIIDDVQMKKVGNDIRISAGIGARCMARVVIEAPEEMNIARLKDLG